MPVKPPAIIGHRGNRQEHGYENTVDALLYAINVADGFETDIVLSKDNHIAIVHDTYYTGDSAHYELSIRLDEKSNATNGKKRIDELTLSDIQNLTLVNGQKIPLLDDLINLIKSNPTKIFDIELKAAMTGVPLVERLLSEGIEFNNGNIFFSSFNHQELLRIREYNPSIPVGALFEPGNTKGCQMYPWLNDTTSIYTPFSLENIQSEDVSKMKPDFFCINDYDLRVENLKFIQQIYPSAKIYSWWYFTETPPLKNNALIHTMKHIQREGLMDMVAGIITDYPAEMKKMFTENFTESQM